MAIQNEPTRIQIPFADSGTKNVIPDTNPTPSASQAASWTDGFPSQCSLPLSAGGIPPARADFNGVFNTMSQSIRFGQEGGVWAWDATVDYAANRVVLGSDGLLYWSVVQSGPNLGGAQDPTADTAHVYWVSPKVGAMPADDSSDAAVSSSWVANWYSSQLLPSSMYLDGINGDDSNDGLTASTAKKTIESVRAFLSSALRIKRNYITINAAPGSYSAINGVLGMEVIMNCSQGAIFNGAFVSGSNRIVRLIGEPTFTRRVMVASGAVIFLGGEAGERCSITFNNASTDAALRSQYGTLRAEFNSQNVSIKFSGTCTFSESTVVADANSSISFAYGQGNATWSVSGSVTGKRYRVAALASLQGVGGPNVIPGTTAGTVHSLGYFS